MREYASSWLKILLRTKKFHKVGKLSGKYDILNVQEKNDNIEPIKQYKTLNDSMEKKDKDTAVEFIQDAYEGINWKIQKIIIRYGCKRYAANYV